jgi:hypothetical protein
MKIKNFFYVAVALVIVSIGLISTGIKTTKLQKDVTETPVNISLEELEAGTNPTSAYITINEHIAFFWNTVYYGSKLSDNIDYIIYPAVSNIDDYRNAWTALAEKYSEDEEVPENEIPKLENIKVFIKTSQYKTTNDIPTDNCEMDSATGLIVNKLDKLDNDVKELIMQSSPDTDFENIIILDIDKTPSDLKMGSLGLIGGIALLIIGLAAAIFIFIKSRKQA